MERRSAQRWKDPQVEATTRALDAQDAFVWGAQVRDISATGIGLSLCYPFRVGAYLAIDLQSHEGGTRTLLTRVVHVHDVRDGTWHVGCELVKPLSDSEIELLV
jgi:hypothetical protein